MAHVARTEMIEARLVPTHPKRQSRLASVTFSGVSRMPIPPGVISRRRCWQPGHEPQPRLAGIICRPEAGDWSGESESCSRGSNSGGRTAKARHESGRGQCGGVMGMLPLVVNGAFGIPPGSGPMSASRAPERFHRSREYS